MPANFYLSVILMLSIITLLVLSFSKTTNGDSIKQVHSLYGCVKFGQKLKCDPSSYKFDSVSVIGHVQPLYTVNQSRFEPVEGVFGNALEIAGNNGKYLTIPDQKILSPPIFTVSFWMKQDPLYLASSSILSHINLAKTAGWIVSLNANKSGIFVGFSVTNADGRVFTASAPTEADIFENVIGTFDGKHVRIFLNGNLEATVEFTGTYNSEPNTPLILGVNAYNFGRPWNGKIDELRLYDRVISDKEVESISEYSQYSKLKFISSSNSSTQERPIGFWPFDNGTQDVSANRNGGNLILQATSMAFSPDGRLFYSVKDAGEIRVISQFGHQLKGPFVRLVDQQSNLRTHQEILGITIDPSFQTNHYIYAYSSTRDNNTGETYNQVIRFTEYNNKATNKTIIVDKIPAGRKQAYAGALAFGPDDKLYIATERTNEKAALQNTSLSGKVLRVNRDGTIPPDNPSQNSSVYRRGLGNMFGIAFDKISGTGLVAENDARNGDKIYQLSLQKQVSSVGLKPSEGGNTTTLQPFRIYYKAITPAQAVFYDSIKFPYLKDKFLVVAQGERSVYAYTIDNSGKLIKELVLRLPEIQGHITSIAKDPIGNIYLGGESIYKLTSIDTNTISPLTYFIDFISNSSSSIAPIKYFYINFDNNIMSINITSLPKAGEEASNSNNSTNSNESLPSLSIVIPKVILGHIFEVTSKKYNDTKNTADKIVQDFGVKETRRVTIVGDSIVDVKLTKEVFDDTILIKGMSSPLFQSAARNVKVLR